MKTSELKNMSGGELLDLWIKLYDKNKPSKDFFKVHKVLTKGLLRLYLGGIEASIEEIEKLHENEKVSARKIVLESAVDCLKDFRNKEKYNLK